MTTREWILPLRGFCRHSRQRFSGAASLMLAVAVALLVGCGEPGEPKANTGGAGRAEGKPLRPAATGDQAAADANDAANDAARPDAIGDAAQATDVASDGADAVALDDPDAEAQRQRRLEWRQERAAAAAGTSADKAAPDKAAASDATSASADDSSASSADTSVPFVDPNNPDYIPADRTRAKNFDHSKLKPVDGFLHVPFMALAGYSYPTQIYVPQGADDPRAAAAEAKQKREIPKNILALDGKKVTIQGYMMPLDFENGGTNEFILTRVIPSCFYCQPPQLNDWIEVKTAGGKRVPYFPDSPINVSGTLRVSELREDGFVVNLYRMESVNVEEAVNP